MVYLTVHSFVVYIWSSSLILNIRIAEAKCNTVYSHVRIYWYNPSDCCVLFVCFAMTTQAFEKVRPYAVQGFRININ